MPSLGYLARRLVPLADTGAPLGPGLPAGSGPAAAVLGSVAVRTTAAIRCLAVGYVIVQIAIWHGYYAASPWRLVAPIAAVVWGVALIAQLAARPATAWLAVADCTIFIVLASSTGWAVPAAMRGDSANWLYVQLAALLVIPLWFTRLAASVPLLLAAGAAYWLGAAMSPAAPGVPNSPGASTILLLPVGIVAWLGYRMLRQRAALADAALAEADADEHAVYVALSRTAERREHERLLHDTVLNTLTALARRAAGETDAREVIGRCQHDVALMEYVLGGSDVDPPAGGAVGGLLVALEATVAEARARGLEVHVNVTAPAGVALAIPVPAVVALARAARESLDNVVRHARTHEAWLTVHLRQPDPGPEGADAPAGAAGAAGAEGAAGPAGVEAPEGREGPEGPEGRTAILVTIRDCGVGFEPGRTGTDRLGVRRSIIERIADSGGYASVQSAPGAGTTVTMCWPGRPP